MKNPPGEKPGGGKDAHSLEECEHMLAALIQEMKAEIAAEKERLKFNKKVS